MHLYTSTAKCTGYDIKQLFLTHVRISLCKLNTSSMCLSEQSTFCNTSSMCLSVQRHFVVLGQSGACVPNGTGGCGL